MSHRQRGRRRLLTWLGLLGALALFRLPRPAQAGEREELADGLVGAWVVSVSYPAGGDPTRGLATFTQDGGFIGSISAYEVDPINPTPSRGTTLHGTWRRMGAGAYALTAARLHLDDRGRLLGTMTTHIALTLDPSTDAWAGTFTFDAADPGGTVMRSAGGTLQATRIG